MFDPRRAQVTEQLSHMFVGHGLGRFELDDEPVVHKQVGVVVAGMLFGYARLIKTRGWRVVYGTRVCPGIVQGAPRPSRERRGRGGGFGMVLGDRGKLKSHK